MDSELKSLISAIENADYDAHPFEHLYATNIFSERFYESLLQALPEDSVYESFSPKRWPDRLQAPLEDLPNPIWKRVASIFKSKELKEALFDRFSKTIKNVPCSPALYLFRDKEQLEIDPHPDIARKVITSQMYLPPDNSHEQFGTKILEGDTLESLKVYKQFKFHRNSYYAFPVGETSWHSYAGFKGTDYKESFNRDTLMCFYYDDKFREIA